jgi:hypothetical protein
MADKEVADLTAAGSLAFANSFHLIQSGNSREATMQQVADLMASLGMPVLIEEYTGDGTTGTKTFSAIPGTYNRLRLVWLARSSDAASTVNIAIQFNGDTGANYDRQQITANATVLAAAEGLGATSAVIATITGAGATAGYAGSGELLIPHYAATTFNKQGRTEHAYQVGTATTNFQRRTSAIGWRSTAAITSITAALSAGNYITGSKLLLYGEN